MTVGILTRKLHARAGKYLELLLHLERVDEAEALLDLVLLRERFASAFLAMQRAARAAGERELARRIGQRALDELPPEELEVYESQGKRIGRGRGR